MFLINTRFNFIRNCFFFIKKNLLKNKFRILIVEKKLENLEKKIIDKFNHTLQHISDNVNKIYKYLTKTKSNPMGGIAFLKFTKIGNIIEGNLDYVSFFSTQKMNFNKNLSGGEKTIASFALIMALNKLIIPPLLICDEIDCNLDNWLSEKIVLYMKDHSIKTNTKIYTITLKIRYAILLNNITYIYKHNYGSDFYKIIV